MPCSSETSNTLWEGGGRREGGKGEKEEREGGEREREGGREDKEKEGGGRALEDTCSLSRERIGFPTSSCPLQLVPTLSH